MVDIHSHVLPGVDDGARTLEESLHMLRLAGASGTTDIVATPHANHQFPFHPAHIQELFLDLSEKSASFIKLHLGCDFHITYENLRDALDNPEKYTINHRNYLMVELPDLIAPASMRLPLKQLVEMRIVPVITHPERNPSMQAQLQELHRWVGDGCLLQVTAQSLLGGFGHDAQHAARSLMNANLVHFIASDAHDCLHRPPDLSAAYKHVTSRYGESRAQALFSDNPAAVLAGLRLQPVPNSPRKALRFFARKK